MSLGTCNSSDDEQIRSEAGERRIGTMIHDELLTAANGTVVTDEDGLPQVLYHGTFAQFDRFEITSDIGFHFGTWAAAQRRRRHAPLRPGSSKSDPCWRMIAACLLLRKPLLLDVDPASWHELPLLSILEERIDPDLYATMQARLSLHRLECQKAEEILDGLIDAKMAGQTITPEQVKRHLAAHFRRFHVYDAQTAESDLVRRQKDRIRKRLASKQPELFRAYRPLLLIRDALREAGYDGIGYVNFYEKKSTVSWVAFDNSAIIRVGDNEHLGRICAPEADIIASCYRRQANPLVAPRLGVRTPNRDYLKPRDIIALNSALFRIASAERNTFSAVSRVRPSTWRAEYEISMECLGVRFIVQAEKGTKCWVPIAVAGQDEKLLVDWPMYADPAEAAKEILTHIYRCAKRLAGQVADPPRIPETV